MVIFLGLIKTGEFLHRYSYPQQRCTGITGKTFPPKPQLFLTARQLRNSANKCNIWVNALFHLHVKHYSAIPKKQNWCD